MKTITSAWLHGENTHRDLTLFQGQWPGLCLIPFPPVLGWSMMVRETLAARQKATSCRPLWPETMGSSSGPPAVDSTSAASLGRPQGCTQVLKHSFCSYHCFLSETWMVLLCSPEQPRHHVWWMSQSRSVSTSTLNNFPGSCMTQTHSANGNLAPRPNCAALILSRWDNHVSSCFNQK